MSFLFNGATNSYIVRTAGNPANTNAFTQAAWIKRTADFSGLKFMGSFAAATDSPAPHDWVINDPGYGTAHYKSTLQVNWSTATAGPTDIFPLNTWVFAAIVGSGANITLRVWDGTAWDVFTVGQTTFVPGRWRLGGTPGGASLTGRMAHLRTWDVALTEAELDAERLSATPVRTAALLSAHSGGGGSIAAALTGESGTAYLNGGGATYDADQPTLSSVTPRVISGTADMPSQGAGSAAGVRYNRILHSGDLSNAVWSKQGNSLVAGAVAAPVGYGTAQRILLNINTGGIYQVMFNLPGGRSIAVMAARKVDTDYCVLKHQKSDFTQGVRGLFNLVTGVWETTAGFGGITVEAAPVRALVNGWWLFGLAASISGDRSLEFFPVVDTQQVPAANRNLDVCAFQYEAGMLMTVHKPTTTTVVSRTLATLTLGLASSTVGAGQQVAATAVLTDSAGVPWDQYGPVEILSSDPAIASVLAGTNIYSDISGRATANVQGVATGTSQISATAAALVSANAALTVGGAIGFFVDIQVEPGWEGTGGWAVGIYQTHATDRFPTTRLFPASNQVFQAALYNGKSRMLVPVPSNVSVTDGQIVQVVLENDDVRGQPADLVGMQPFSIVAG